MADRLPVATLLVACLLLGAVACSACALLALRTREAEVAELRREVAAVRARVGVLRDGSSAIAGRLRATERTLRRRETGLVSRGGEIAIPIRHVCSKLRAC